MGGKTTLALSAPIDLASLPSLHPVLAFYAKYAAAFQDLAHNSPAAYYAPDAYINLPHGTTLTGRDKIWAFYEHVYSPFHTNSIEAFYTASIVSVDDLHTLHMEYVRGLHSKDGTTVTTVPQVFVYELGPAAPGQGEGTGGLQIWGVRCYYDERLMVKAAKLEGYDIAEFASSAVEDMLK
jgi:hypothetical protein